MCRPLWNSMYRISTEIEWDSIPFCMKEAGLLTTNPIEYRISTCNTISHAKRCQHSRWGARLCAWVWVCIKFSPSKKPFSSSSIAQYRFYLSSFIGQANVLGQKQFGHIKWPINVILHHILIENRYPQCSLSEKKKSYHRILSLPFWQIVVYESNQKKMNCLFGA